MSEKRAKKGATGRTETRYLSLVSLALTNLSRRKVRTYLTMLGIVIGIAAVVSLMAIGQGLNDAVREQFEMMGSDTILIYGSGGMVGGLLTGNFDDDDLRAVSSVHGVDVVVPYIQRVTRVEYRDESFYTFVYSMPSEGRGVMESMFHLEILRGRSIRPGDRHAVVVGYRYYTGDVFSKPVKVGDKLVINGVEFTVVGVYDEIGNRMDDSTLYIPFDTIKDLFSTGDEYQGIVVKVKPNYDPGEVAEKIRGALREERNLEKGEENFLVQTAEELMESASIVLGAINAILIGLAAISLLVGGVGIMNSMYMSVLERTREIGTLKAIGARNTDVMFLFLFESGLLGLLGGVMGVILGGLLSFGVATIASQALGTILLRASITPLLVAGALGFSFLVGMISGVMPAMRAARLNPVEALRYE